MKSIIKILFASQLFVIVAYGIFFFRGDTFHTLASDNMTLINLDFRDIDDFETFLHIVYEKDLHISRILFLSFLRDQSLVVYTSDVTLGGLITMNSGYFPSVGTNEFISNIDTGEEMQIGTINDIMPGFQLIIKHMDSPENFGMNGRYYIHTSDENLLEELLQAAADYIGNFEIEQILDGEISLWERFASGFGTGTHPIEFLAILLILLLCTIFSVAQYAIHKLRISSICLLHGYSKQKIMLMTSRELLIILVLSAISAYAISILYSWHQGYTLFLVDLSIYFSFITLFLLFTYLVIFNGTMQLHLMTNSTVSIVKGKKPHVFIQICNHILKAIFLLPSSEELCLL